MDAWRAHAACRGRDVALWFPARLDRVGRDVALAICRGCPVRSECLSSALDEELRANAAPSGIRGGTMPNAREMMLRTIRRRAAESRSEVYAAAL